MRKINIAIDGHSSTGKSTLAKQLAARLNYRYIDSGAMYRAVCLYALNAGIAGEGVLDEKKLIAMLPQIEMEFKRENDANHLYLNGADVEAEIRSMRVSEHVSLVAQVAEVRVKLRSAQQDMAYKKGVVMDGRDIGSAVLPDAELKIFMTAQAEVRARRRHKELQSKGVSVSLEEVRQNIDTRDRIDSSRKTDPLLRVEDALVLDNSNLSAEEQLKLAHQWALDTIQKEEGSIQ